jgi:hypothetical protein
MPFLAPNSKFQVLKISRRVGPKDFLGTLGGSYDLCRRERGWLKVVCAMGSSRPML